MNKSTLLCALITFCGVAHAEDNWQPLPVQSAAAQPEVAAAPTKKTGSVATPQFSFSTEYVGYEAKLENGDKAKLDGVALGFSTAPQRQGGFWTRFEYQNSSDYDADYYELASGGQLRIFNQNNVYALASIGLGYTVVDTSYVSDTAEFISLPVGLEVGYTFGQNVSLFGGVGYKWLWDITSSEECTSYSYYTSCQNTIGDVIGDVDGVTYRAGVRYSF